MLEGMVSPPVLLGLAALTLLALTLRPRGQALAVPVRE